MRLHLNAKRDLFIIATRTCTTYANVGILYVWHLAQNIAQCACLVSTALYARFWIGIMRALHHTEHRMQRAQRCRLSRIISIWTYLIIPNQHETSVRLAHQPRAISFVWVCVQKAAKHYDLVVLRYIVLQYALQTHTGLSKLPETAQTVCRNSVVWQYIQFLISCWRTSFVGGTSMTGQLRVCVSFNVGAAKWNARSFDKCTCCANSRYVIQHTSIVTNAHSVYFNVGIFYQHCTAELPRNNRWYPGHTTTTMMATTTSELLRQPR